MSKADRNYDDFASIIPVVEGVDNGRVLGMVAAEFERYQERTPKSFALLQRAKKHMINGVPTTWHSDWGLPYSFYVDRAKNATLWDIDGNEYVDFNLADTPAIFGHSPDNEVTRGIADQLLNKGVTTMAPNEDAVVVSELLAEHYGLPYWYVTLSASDSARNAINIARSITGRSRILMFNLAYHGTGDETLCWRPRPEHDVTHRWSHLRPGIDAGAHTSVAEFNDLDQVEAILSKEDVAILMTEPHLTDGGFTLPIAGWHESLRELCNQYGTLLLIDETHTQTAGPGGLTREWGLSPDLFISGKCIAAGFPVGVIGMSESVAQRYEALLNDGDPSAMGGCMGQGTTNTANAICLKALRLSLEHNFSEETFAKMNSSMDTIERGMNGVITKHGAPFRTDRFGARMNVSFLPEKAYDAKYALQSIGFGGLHEYWTYYCLNRGVLFIPFFNMIITSPYHSNENCERVVQLWDEVISSLFDR
jgi:glutamate-1-semialdehyde 2,1-aminomutase